MTARFGYLDEWFDETAFGSACLKRELFRLPLRRVRVSVQRDKVVVKGQQEFIALFQTLHNGPGKQLLRQLLRVANAEGLCLIPGLQQRRGAGPLGRL